MRLKSLDLFCGAGGASMGLHRAGFEVIGVDLKPQPRYPFQFVQADALMPPFRLENFDFIWASPPCQDHMLTPHRKHGTAWMLPAVREILEKSDSAWVIENVPGAPLRVDLEICACRFGSPNLRRNRWFETSWRHFELSPLHSHLGPAISVVGHGTPSWVRAKLGRCPSIEEYRELMGIDWMNRGELSQAIPPAYSEYIARAFLAQR